MLTTEQREKIKSTLQKMIDEGADEDTIKEFTAKVKAKYGSPPEAPVKVETKEPPTMGQALFPATSEALKSVDKEKMNAWKVNPSEPDYIDAPGGRRFNSKKYENPERTKAISSTVKGAASDALSLLPRAAGTVAGEMGRTTAINGAKSAKEAMADPDTHIFRTRVQDNYEGFKNGRGPGKYLDLLQGIGWDALGDPTSYMGVGIPAKVAKGLNLLSQGGKATAGTLKSVARGVSGIAGKTADKEEVLDYAAKRGIDALEGSKPMDELFMELNNLSETESLALRKILQNSKSDLFEAIEKKKENLSQLSTMEKDQLKSAIQKAKDEAGLAQDAVKKSVQKGRDEIDLDVDTKSSNFKADKDRAQGKYSSLLGGFKEELTQDIPNKLSRETKKKVYSKFDEVTEPIEQSVTVDFTNSPFSPQRVVNSKMKYGTPEFDKFKADLVADIEKRLGQDPNSGRTIVSGDVLLKEKKLYQELADGTFGEVTDAQKTLYKDLARTYREVLEDAAVKSGNPEYVKAMREKADVTRAVVDAEETFLPMNLSKDLEVHKKVRTTVEKLESTPEFMDKLRRLDAALSKHGVNSSLSTKASEMIKYAKASDLAKSGKMDDLAKLREIDPEIADALIKQSNEVTNLKESGSKLGRVKSVKDMDELESIRTMKPALYKEIKDRLEKANIAEEGINGVKRLREIDPQFAGKLDAELSQLKGLKKASRGLNKVSDFQDVDLLAGLESVNPRLAQEIKDKLQRAQVASKGKSGLTSMASLYRKGIGAEDLRKLDEFYGTNYYQEAIDARTMVDLGAGNSGRIPGFGSKFKTGYSNMAPNLGAEAGGAIAGSPGRAIGSGLLSILQSPKKAIQMTQLANGISRLSDMPVALDKIIAAAEAGNVAAVLRWLDKNGLNEEEKR